MQEFKLVEIQGDEAQGPKKTNFIKKSHLLEAKDELDEKDLDMIVEEMEKIESKKEIKEHFQQ